MSIENRPLSVRRAILFTLASRHLPNRKNVIIILIDRAHPARREHQLRGVLHPPATWSARSSLLVLTVAAAEAAIGLAILVVYFRNRGSIMVEDINLMKG